MNENDSAEVADPVAPRGDDAPTGATPAPDPPEQGALPAGSTDHLDARQMVERAAPETVRRAPRYGRFALAGVLVGAFAAALAAVVGPPGEVLGRGAIFLLLFLLLGSVGALVGAVLAVLADRRSRPGARS